MARKVLTGAVVQAGEFTPREAADYVAESWASAVEGIIETGRRLAEAKDRVGHSNWLPTVALLPFSERTARALMQVARHPDLSNRQHVADLPASWGTLAVLAQLPEGEVAKRIEAREITPDLQRATAQDWVNRYTAAHQESLNSYSQAVDNVTAALSYAKSYAPSGLTDAYVSIDELVTRIETLLEIARTWRNQ